MTVSFVKVGYHIDLASDEKSSLGRPGIYITLEPIQDILLALLRIRCGLRPPSDRCLYSQHQMINGGRPRLPAGPDRP